MEQFISNLPNTQGPVVCIFSGGLDSTVLLYALSKKYDVRAITFDYKQRHSIELEKSKITCKKLDIPQKIVDISFLDDITKGVSSLSSTGNVQMDSDGTHANYVVPFRNLVFQSIALSYAETIQAMYVFTGVQNGDNEGFWDCRPGYYKALNQLAGTHDTLHIEVLTPFIRFTKEDEIRLGNELGVPFEDTWTCYNPQNGKPCCECHSCRERLQAFKNLRLKDPLE